MPRKRLFWGLAARNRAASLPCWNRCRTCLRDETSREHVLCWMQQDGKWSRNQKNAGARSLRCFPTMIAAGTEPKKAKKRTTARTTAPRSILQEASYQYTTPRTNETTSLFSSSLRLTWRILSIYGGQPCFLLACLLACSWLLSWHRLDRLDDFSSSMVVIRSEGKVRDLGSKRTHSTRSDFQRNESGPICTIVMHKIIQEVRCRFFSDGACDT